jgi:hypothetical protein
MAPADALPHLPRCEADGDATRALEQGKRVPWAALRGAPSPEGHPRVRILRPDGRLLAVAEPRHDDAGDATVKTLRVFGVADGAGPLPTAPQEVH